MIKIKIASRADLPLIQQLAFTIWPIAYKNILSQQQLEYMLKKMHSIQSLSMLMDQKHEFIIPYEDSIPRGYACYAIHSEKARLEKLYVMPGEQKKGIGTLLLNYIIEKAKPAVGTLELNVNRENKSVDFYKSAGFVIVRAEDIDIGNGYFMNDYVMSKII